ncbi:MAG: ATP-binding protein [Candidatus Gastranaerophilaceae bacterium]
MSKNLNIDIVKELLKIKPDGTLFHRENSTLEYKEQFNFAGLADYLKDFAAFANNNGGYLIFGIKDKPRTLIGMSQQSIKQFEKIDPQKITGGILEHFSSEIKYEYDSFFIDERTYGVFYISEIKNKPIIAKKDAGNIFKNGEIHYRYGGRTDKIRYAELEAIINERIEQTNKEWRSFLRSSSNLEPSKTHLLTSQSSAIGKDNNILYIDENTAKKINFLKEGEFKEKAGEKAIMLIGQATMLEAHTIEKEVEKNLFELYPYTYTEIAEQIKEKNPAIKQNDINEIIKENNIKKKKEYSAYNFRNKEQKVKYETEGILPKNITSIYNQNAIEYILEAYKQ